MGGGCMWIVCACEREREREESLWPSAEHACLLHRCKEVQTPIALLRSLSYKHYSESYETHLHPLPSRLGL